MIIVSSAYDLCCKYSGGPVKSLTLLINSLAPYRPISFIYFTSRNRSKTPLDLFSSSNPLLFRSFPFFNLLTIFSLLSRSGFKRNSIYFPSFFAFFSTILPFVVFYPFCRKTRFAISSRGELLQLDKKKRKKTIYILFFKLYLYFFGSERLVFHLTSDLEYQSFIGIFPALRGFMIPNFAPSTIYHSSACVSPSVVSMLSVGRISPEKQSLFTALFLRKFKDIYPHIQFKCTFVGAFNPSTPAYTKAFLSAIDDSCFEHIEFMSNDNIQILMRSSHIFISATDGENFGHAIYEAICNSMKLLIRDTTQFTSLYEQRIGLCVNSLDESSWIHLLYQLLTDSSFNTDNSLIRSSYISNLFPQENLSHDYLSLLFDV